MTLRKGGLYAAKRLIFFSSLGWIETGEIVMFIGSYPLKAKNGEELVKDWAEIWILRGEKIDKIHYEDSIKVWEKDWELVC